MFRLFLLSEDSLLDYNIFDMLRISLVLDGSPKKNWIKIQCGSTILELHFGSSGCAYLPFCACFNTFSIFKKKSTVFFDVAFFSVTMTITTGLKFGSHTAAKVTVASVWMGDSETLLWTIWSGAMLEELSNGNFVEESLYFIHCNISFFFCWKLVLLLAGVFQRRMLPRT